LHKEKASEEKEGKGSEGSGRLWGGDKFKPVLYQPSRGQRLGSVHRASFLEQMQFPFPGCGVYTSDIDVHQRNTLVPGVFWCLGITFPQLARQWVTLLRAISVATGVGSSEALVLMVGQHWGQTFL
jgi:hypothetical protein